MFEKLDELLNALDKGDAETSTFCSEFVKVLQKCLSTPGLPLDGQLVTCSWAINIYSRARPKVGNLDVVDDMSRTLFQACARAILNEKFQTLVGAPALEKFILAVNAACVDLSRDGYSHRFMMLQYLMRNPWDHPVLLAIMMGEPIEKEAAFAYIETGEFPELFHLRVQMLMQSGCDDFALNLCNWCTQVEKFQVDPYIRGVQLVLLFDRGLHDIMHEECKLIPCCIGKEVIHCLQNDYSRSEACLELAQTFLVKDWLRPRKYCCTKDLLFHWLISRRRTDVEDNEFIFNVGKLLETASSTWQLMALVDVMHQLFDNEFMQFCTEVCILGLVTEKHNLDLARQENREERIKSAKGSLTLACSVLSCLASDWCVKLRKLSMLAALTLEPNRDIYDALVKLYSQALEESQVELEAANRRSSEKKEKGLKGSSEEKDEVKQLLEIPGVSPPTASTIWHILSELRSEKLNPELTWQELRMPCFRLVLAEEAVKNAARAEEDAKKKKKEGKGLVAGMANDKTLLKNGVIFANAGSGKTDLTKRRISDLKAYRQSLKRLNEKSSNASNSILPGANSTSVVHGAANMQRKMALTKTKDDKNSKLQAIKSANERIYAETKRHGGDFTYLNRQTGGALGQVPISKVQTPTPYTVRQGHVKQELSAPKPLKPTIVIDAGAFNPHKRPNILGTKSGARSTVSSTCQPKGLVQGIVSTTSAASLVQAPGKVAQGLDYPNRDNVKTHVVKTLSKPLMTPATNMSQAAHSLSQTARVPVVSAAVGASVIQTAPQPVSSADSVHVRPSTTSLLSKSTESTHAQNPSAIQTFPTSSVTASVQSVLLPAPHSKIKMIYHQHPLQRPKTRTVPGVQPVIAQSKTPGGTPHQISHLSSNHVAAGSGIHQRQTPQIIQKPTPPCQAQVVNTAMAGHTSTTPSDKLLKHTPHLQQLQTQPLLQLQQQQAQQQQQPQQSPYHQLLSHPGPPKPSRRVSAKLVIPPGANLTEGHIPGPLKIIRVPDQIPQSQMRADTSHVVPDLPPSAHSSPQAIAISGDMDVNTILKGLMNRPGANSQSFAQVIDPNRKFFKTRTVALNPGSLQNMLVAKEPSDHSYGGGGLGHASSNATVYSQAMSGQSLLKPISVPASSLGCEQVMNRSQVNYALSTNTNNRDRNIFAALTPTGSPMAKNIGRANQEVNSDNLYFNRSAIGVSADGARMEQGSCELIADSEIQCDVTQEQVIGSEDSMFSDYASIQPDRANPLGDNGLSFGGPTTVQSFNQSLQNTGLNDLPVNMMNNTNQLPPVQTGLLSPEFDIPQINTEQPVYGSPVGSPMAGYGAQGNSSMPYMPNALPSPHQSGLAMPLHHQPEINQDFCETTLLPTGTIDTEPGRPSVGKNKLGEGADPPSSPGSEETAPSEEVSGKDPLPSETKSLLVDSQTPSLSPANDRCQTQSPPSHGAGTTEHGAGTPDHGPGPTDHGTGPTDHGTGPTGHGTGTPDHRTATPGDGSGTPVCCTCTQGYCFCTPDHKIGTPNYGIGTPEHVTDLAKTVGSNQLTETVSTEDYVLKKETSVEGDQKPEEGIASVEEDTPPNEQEPSEADIPSEKEIPREGDISHEYQTTNEDSNCIKENDTPCGEVDEPSQLSATSEDIPQVGEDLIKPCASDGNAPTSDEKSNNEHDVIGKPSWEADSNIPHSEEIKVEEDMSETIKGEIELEHAPEIPFGADTTNGHGLSLEVPTEIMEEQCIEHEEHINDHSTEQTQHEEGPGDEPETSENFSVESSPHPQTRDSMPLQTEPAPATDSVDNSGAISPGVEIEYQSDASQEDSDAMPVLDAESIRSLSPVNSPDEPPPLLDIQGNIVVVESDVSGTLCSEDERGPLVEEAQENLVQHKGDGSKVDFKEEPCEPPFLVEEKPFHGEREENDRLPTLDSFENISENQSLDKPEKVVNCEESATLKGSDMNGSLVDFSPSDEFKSAFCPVEQGAQVLPMSDSVSMEDSGNKKDCTGDIVTAGREVNLPLGDVETGCEKSSSEREDRETITDEAAEENGGQDSETRSTACNSPEAASVDASDPSSKDLNENNSLYPVAGEDILSPELRDGENPSDEMIEAATQTDESDSDIASHDKAENELQSSAGLSTNELYQESTPAERKIVGGDQAEAAQRGPDETFSTLAPPVDCSSPKNDKHILVSEPSDEPLEKDSVARRRSTSTESPSPSIQKSKDHSGEWLYVDSDDEISFHIPNDNEDIVRDSIKKEREGSSPNTSVTELPKPKAKPRFTSPIRPSSTSPRPTINRKYESPKTHGTWTGYKWMFSTDKSHASSSPKAHVIGPSPRARSSSCSPKPTFKTASPKPDITQVSKVQHSFSPIRKMTPPSDSNPKSYIVKIIPDTFEVRVSPQNVEPMRQVITGKRKITPASAPVMPSTPPQKNNLRTDCDPTEVTTKGKPGKEVKSLEPVRKSRRPSTQRDSTATASLYKLSCARKNSTDSFSDNSPLGSPRRPDPDSPEKKSSPNSPPKKRLPPMSIDGTSDTRKRKLSVGSCQSDKSLDEVPRRRRRSEFYSNTDDSDIGFSDGSSIDEESAAHKNMLKRLQNSPGFVPEVVEGKTRFGFLRHPEREEKPSRSSGGERSPVRKINQENKSLCSGQSKETNVELVSEKASRTSLEIVSKAGLDDKGPAQKPKSTTKKVEDNKKAYKVKIEKSEVKNEDHCWNDTVKAAKTSPKDKVSDKTEIKIEKEMAKSGIKTEKSEQSKTDPDRRNKEKPYKTYAKAKTSEKVESKGKKERAKPEAANEKAKGKHDKKERNERASDKVTVKSKNQGAKPGLKDEKENPKLNKSISGRSDKVTPCKVSEKAKVSDKDDVKGRHEGAKLGNKNERAEPGKKSDNKQTSKSKEKIKESVKDELKGKKEGHASGLKKEKPTLNKEVRSRSDPGKSCKKNDKTQGSEKDNMKGKKEGAKSRVKMEQGTSREQSTEKAQRGIQKESSSRSKSEKAASSGKKEISPPKTEEKLSAIISQVIPSYEKDQFRINHGHIAPKCDCHRMPSKYKCWNPDCARSAQVMNGPARPAAPSRPDAEEDSNIRLKITDASEMARKNIPVFNEPSVVKSYRTEKATTPVTKAVPRKRQVIQSKSEDVIKKPRIDSAGAGFACRTEEGGNVSISFAQIKEKFTLTKFTPVAHRAKSAIEPKPRPVPEKLKTSHDGSDVEDACLDWTQGTQSQDRFKHIKTYSRTPRSKLKSPRNSKGEDQYDTENFQGAFHNALSKS